MPLKRVWYPFIALLCVLMPVSDLYGVPSSPRIHELVQPDGASINACQWGDEFHHGWETTEGYSIVKNSSGVWVYAERDTGGRLLPTMIKADKPAPEGIQRFLRPGAEIVKRTPGRRRGGAVKVVSSTGTAKVPVILINFNDTTTTNTPSEFESLLFESNPAIATGPGSMKDYYEEVSYGAFSVSSGPSGVSEWVTAANGHDYYGQDDGDGDDMNPAELVKEAVQKADAAGFDFSQYDNDGDGKVDVVMVVHQGEGEEVSGTTTDIWSHRWTLTAAGVGSVSVDGVTVNDYAIQPEQADASMNTIGVFCHEFGHALGLPDLYDTDYTSWGIGDWGIMAFGSYNKDTNDGDSPAHMMAWSKYFLGWVTPTQVSSTLACAPIDRASHNDDVYQLLSGTPTSGEYFLVENRQKAGFDQGLPGEGLLVWHIDGDTIDSNRSANTVNDNECYPGGPSCATNHYGVALVQADNLWDLEQKADQGDSGDPFPGSTNNTLFTDTSSPNSKLWNGTESTVGVGNIAYSFGRYVAFESDATNLVENDTNNAKDIFVYDRDDDAIERVSVADDGTAGDNESYNASISSDGRYVAFDSLASNLVPGDTNGSGNVYMYDRTNDTIEHINTSYDATEESWSGSQRPFISADGSFVAFDSDATNLVVNDTNGSKDIFIAPSGTSGASTSTTVASATTTTVLITTTTSIEELCPTELLYGEHSNEAELLRYWRDSVLSNLPEGREIIRLYYELGPVIVKALEEDEEFKAAVRELIEGILPLIGPEAK